MWGVYEFSKCVHVSPCTEEGRSYHELCETCECHPSIMTDPGWSRAVIIHHEGH